MIRDPPGVINAADNILVHGHTISEHTECLFRLLKRLPLVNLTVNGGKCKIGQQSIEFYGLKTIEFNGLLLDRLTKQGIKLMPKKVQAIIDAERLQNAAEVRSGTMGFSTWFIPNLSTIAELLGRLTISGTTFT